MLRSASASGPHEMMSRIESFRHNSSPISHHIKHQVGGEGGGRHTNVMVGLGHDVHSVNTSIFSLANCVCTYVTRQCDKDTHQQFRTGFNCKIALALHCAAGLKFILQQSLSCKMGSTGFIGLGKPPLLPRASISDVFGLDPPRPRISSFLVHHT